MTAPAPRSRALTITSWVLSILVGPLLAFGGATKLAGTMGHPDHFAHWGYPLWFMYVIGALELLGGLGVLVPRTRGLAALGLAGIMIGAVFTHVKSGEPVTAPLPFLVLSAVIAFLERDSLRALVGRRDAATARPAA